MKTNIYFESTAIVPDRRSGIGHAILELLRELDSDKYISRYSVVAFVPFGEGVSLERYQFKNISIRQLPFPHKVFSLLSRLNYGIPIDLFLGKGIYVFPNYRNFNLIFSKSITFVHDVCYLIYPNYIQPKNLAYLQKNMPKWLKRTDKVVTISHSSKSEIMEYLDERDADIAVVELGVDQKVFYPRCPREVRDIKSKYNIKGNYFLYVGNIEPRKNLSFLVDSFAKNENLKQHTLFLVGGGGWLNKDILESIDAANMAGFNVVRSGRYVPDEDIPVLMSGSTAVILPSHHEGFGLSAVQAGACGVPIVASDIPVLREIGGDTYHYFKNKDTESFKVAVQSALKEKHALNPRIEYTWEHTVDKLLKLIKDLK